MQTSHLLVRLLVALTACVAIGSFLALPHHEHEIHHEMEGKAALEERQQAAQVAAAGQASDANSEQDSAMELSALTWDADHQVADENKKRTTQIHAPIKTHLSSAKGEQAGGDRGEQKQQGTTDKLKAGGMYATLQNRDKRHRALPRQGRKARQQAKPQKKASSVPTEKRSQSRQLLAAPPLAEQTVKPASAFPICQQYPKACQCVERDPPLLVYNRVPKCASGTTQVFMEFAKRITDIEFCRGKRFLNRYLPDRQLSNFRQNPTKEVCYQNYNKNLRVVINWHAFYASLPQTAPNPPMYFNVIREPLSRAQSLFYYERDAWGVFPKGMTLDQCMASPKHCPFGSDQEVQKRVRPFHVGLREHNVGSRSRKNTFLLETGTNYMTFWFCGMNSSCSVGDRSTLEEAKRVMAEEYAFVGLQSRLNDTFFIMQTMFPDWFASWGSVLPKEGEPCNKCDHDRPPPMSTSTREKFSKILSMDLELYAFAQELFEAKFHACHRTARETLEKYGLGVPVRVKTAEEIDAAAPAVPDRLANGETVAGAADGSVGGPVVVVAAAAAAATTVDPPSAAHDKPQAQPAAAASRPTATPVALRARARAPLPVATSAIKPESAFGDICTTYPAACTCTPADPRGIVYNRVPKCASGTVQVFMELAQRSTHIEFCRGKRFLHRYLQGREQTNFRRSPTQQVCNQPYGPNKRVVMNWHAVYTPLAGDATSRSEHGPVYFNVVREPIARIQSRFYYDRDTWSSYPKGTTLDQCLASAKMCPFATDGEIAKRTTPPYIVGQKAFQVAERSRRATFDLEAGANYLALWFCGTQEVCKSHDRATLEEAKRVLAEEYAFVGLQSRLNDTFFIMQTMYPDWFGTWGTVLAEYGEPCNKCGHDPPPPMSAASRSKLEKLHQLDIDLYEFAERVFDAKFHACLRTQQRLLQLRLPGQT